MKNKILIASPIQSIIESIDKAVKSLGFDTVIVTSSRQYDEFDDSGITAKLVDESFSPTDGVVICTQEKADYYRLQSFTTLVNPFSIEDLKRCLGVKNTSCILGESKIITELRKIITKLAPHSIPVYIHGESGVGKELVATDLHNLSERQGEFVRINCAGFTAELLNSELFGHVKGAFTGADRNKVGLVEVANGGTLFLDEVGDMPMQCQAQLLRVLENGTYLKVGETKAQYTSARIVCATHHSLKDLVKERKFREDLYFRLNGYTINVPPLRSRQDDIPLLLKSFLPGVRFEDTAVAYLSGLTWPGNVRELKQLCQRIDIFKEEGEVVGTRLIKSMLDHHATETEEVSSINSITPPTEIEATEIEEVSLPNQPDKKEQITQYIVNNLPTKEDVMSQYISTLRRLLGDNIYMMSRVTGIARQTLTAYVEKMPVSFIESGNDFNIGINESMMKYILDSLPNKDKVMTQYVTALSHALDGNIPRMMKISGMTRNAVTTYMKEDENE